MDVKALVGKLPGPGKLGSRPAPLDEPDGDEAPPEYGSDEDHAAEVSAAQRVADALGIKGIDADEFCAALKDFIATTKPEEV